MAAYRRVYDSRHLQADCQEPGSTPEPTLGNRVWATFFYSSVTPLHPIVVKFELFKRYSLLELMNFIKNNIKFINSRIQIIARLTTNIL